MYCIVDLIKTDEGWSPSLPSDTRFALLAEPYSDDASARFGLFKCEFSDDQRRLFDVERVSNKLCELLESAEGYPPAMALTREEISKSKIESKSRFSALLVAVLEKYLRAQPSDTYVLAESLNDEVGYREKGGYYWIVRLVDENVGWVSRDYFMYTDPISDFNMDKGKLSARLKRE